MARILFLGQRPLGETCFQLCLDHQAVEILGASSNSTKNGWWRTNGIYTACSKYGITFVDNSHRNEDDLLKLIVNLRIDTIFSVQHCWILSNDILNSVSGRAFNLHMAKLPEYKGHYPFAHAILNDENQYTVTLHWMSPKVDSGLIAYTGTFPISKTDTAYDLYRRACKASVEIFMCLLDDIAKDRTPPTTKMTGEPKFYSRNSLSPQECIIDMGDEREVDLKSRALFFPPFTPAYGYVGSRRVFVLPERLGEFEQCNLFKRGDASQ